MSNQDELLLAIKQLLDAQGASLHHELQTMQQSMEQKIGDLGSRVEVLENGQNQKDTPIFSGQGPQVSSPETARQSMRFAVDIADLPGKQMQGRRLVTVLFADVSGFTAMSETMEPDEVQDVMNRIFQPLTAEIERMGGWVDKYIGDCIMAVFGYPRSWGDDATRAARAALRMQEQLRRLADELEPFAKRRVSMRIGLHTGLVQAGLLGGGQRAAYTVIGDTVNTAKRFEENCPVGGILVSAMTHRQIIDRFVLEEGGPISLKGKSEPVRGFRLVRERLAAITDWNFSFHGRPIPFMGHEEEATKLLGTYQKVHETRQPACVLVTGESGMGKSRLIIETCRKAAEHGALVLHGRGSGYLEGQLAHPLLHAVSEWLERGNGSAEQVFMAHWEAGRVNEGASATQEEPLLKTLRRWLFAPFNNAITPPDLAAEKDLLIRALSLLLGRLSPGGVVILVISQLEFADYLTVEVLSRLISPGDQEHPLPLLLLAEQTVVNSEGATLLQRAGGRELKLAPLSREELTLLAGEILKPEADLPDWLMHWALGQSNGNPMFFLEHLYSLEPLGLMEVNPESRTWKIPAEPPPDLALPLSVHAAAQATLDRLDEAESLVCSLGASVGHVFWDRLLYALMAGRHPAETVERALGTLVERGLLLRRGRGALPQSREYRFVNDVMRQVAHTMLPRRAIRNLHQTIAQALLHMDPTGVLWPLSAEHFSQAGDRVRWAQVSLKAADQLLHRGILEEAKKILDQIAGEFEAGSIHLEPGPAVLLELELSVHQAEHLRYRGLYPEAGALLAEMLKKVDIKDITQEGDPRRVWVARLFLTLGNCHQIQGRAAEAVQALEQAHRLYEKGDVAEDIHLDLEASRAWALIRLGRIDQARTLVTEHLAPYPETSAEFYPVRTTLALARLYDTLGEIAKRDRHLDDARSNYQIARSLKEQSGNLRLLAVSDSNLAIIDALTGDWEGAAGKFTRILAFHESWGAPYSVGIARYNLAESLLKCGHTQDGDRYRELARELATRHGIAEILDQISLLDQEFPPIAVGSLKRTQ